MKIVCEGMLKELMHVGGRDNMFLPVYYCSLVASPAVVPPPA
jgi:hypothetical protein